MSSDAGVASGSRAATIAPIGRSSMAEAARMFRKSGSALFGLALVVVLGAAALLAPLLAPHDPDAIDTARRLARPFTAGHPLGTDEFGRDLLSRLLHGARTSLVVGLAATALAAAAGSICGLLAGFVGRWVDQLVMRSIDTLMAFPYFLLAIAILPCVASRVRRLWTRSPTTPEAVHLFPIITLGNPVTRDRSSQRRPTIRPKDPRAPSPAATWHRRMGG